MRVAALSNVAATAPALGAPMPGTIELLNERGKATIVLPFGGGDAYEVLRAALVHWPDPDSSIFGGSVRDQDRRLIALATKRNPAATTPPGHSPLTSSRTTWPDGAADRRDPKADS